MSRHVPRRERWSSDGPERFRSVDGLLVRRYKGQWWADVAYRLLPDEPAPGEAAAGEACLDCLGPFKRPRNAMVEAERHVTLLRNRFGERVHFQA